MKKLITGIILLTLSALTFAADKYANLGQWWNIPYPTQFDMSQLTNQQDYISVKGKYLVDEQQQKFLFKGVNIADPVKLLNQGKWSKALFTEVKNWGANVIRLPIHPVSWRELGEDKYFVYIDEAVKWANALGMYLIIDWHSIGYLPNELFQHPMYDTTQKETLTFWKNVSFRYKHVPTIAVYELFNEPTTLAGTGGKADWLEWKAFNEKLIDIIYATDRKVIPLVAGFDWAYDLRPVAKNPIQRSGIAYTVHPYPQKVQPKIKSKENFFKLWQQVWGFVADDYPIIATELGWVNADGKGAHIPVIDDGSYGPHIIEFMNARNISWVAWVFDPDWSPTMISDWDYTPTQQGAFFKQQMLKN